MSYVCECTLRTNPFSWWDVTDWYDEHGGQHRTCNRCGRHIF